MEEETVVRSLEDAVLSLRASSVLGTETDPSVSELVCSWEEVFLHGYKTGSSFFFSGKREEVSWWGFVKELLSKDDRERISSTLPNVNTETGWARAWIRISLNERSLKRVLLSIEEPLVSEYYEPKATLRDPKSRERLSNLAEKLQTQRRFALVFDHPDLNQSRLQNEMEAIIIARIESDIKKYGCNRKSKRRKNQVVSFDEPPSEKGIEEPVDESLKVDDSIKFIEEPPVITSLTYDELSLECNEDDENEEELNESTSPRAYSPRLTPVKYAEIGTLTPIRNDSIVARGDSSSPSSDIETNSYDDRLEREELKTHLISVLDFKEELQNRCTSLKELLDSESRVVVSLKEELETIKRKTKDNEDKKDAKISTLNRENELLKHQLKKYVGAVQRLRDGPNAYETIAKLEKDTSMDSNSASTYVDYHYEASEYEKKLIQVAEMHGELLEFNESLQKKLKFKERLLKRYKEELEILRGPLVSEDDEEEKDVEDESPSKSASDSVALPVNSRFLINIWIPSVFLSGASTSSPSSSNHHVYQVYLRIRDEEWNIYRRYSEFYSLHKRLKKQEAQVGTFDFPPKKSVGYKADKVVEDRRKRLQTYLRNVVNLMIQKNLSLAERPDKETLLKLMPFFGELRPRRNSSTRSTSSVTTRNQASPSSIFSRRRNQADNSAAPQLAL